MPWVLAPLIALYIVFIPLIRAWNPVVVKNVTTLGPQLSPDVTVVSRDGGYSALINGNIVWLYDDTECMDLEGDQLSFVSNTAAYQTFNKNGNVSTVADFGVVNLGKNTDGSPKAAILAGTTVGTGGWIPFQPDELDFNQQMNGKERVAIWPGTSPTPISTTQSFLYAPLVYVDYKPQDPSKEYSPRGMTLITITAPSSGPVAIRQGDLIIPGTEVAFGGFSTLLGYKCTDSTTDPDEGDRDAYLLGMTNSGLQLARVGIDNLTNFAKYTFWNPQGQNFSMTPPKPDLIENAQIYLPGTFSSGSMFYSPYFSTFVMVYFNKMADSTFYMRYLQLNGPLGTGPTWIAGGKNGKGIEAEDVEALVRYTWSAEQKLYLSTPGPGGFNYAGMAHPEYFNTQYFPQSLYPDNTPRNQRINDWYGPLAQSSAGSDGKHLLLSWTEQTGGKNGGLYQVQLAMLEFDDIPANSDAAPSPTVAGKPEGPTPSSTQKPTPPHVPVSSILAMIGKGSAGRAWDLMEALCWCGALAITQLAYAAGLHRRLL
ncbi:hypothetical protein P7C71_g3195, partial [Lecanoromycetidae sp. Uapishka_2]